MTVLKQPFTCVIKKITPLKQFSCESHKMFYNSFFKKHSLQLFLSFHHILDDNMILTQTIPIKQRYYF